MAGRRSDAISGATSTTYSFTAATGEDGYEYEAKFTNSAGTVTTAAATLSVPPVVNTSPANETVNVGGTATFTAAATGTPTPAVQWYVSTNSGGTFSKISGATSASLSIVNANTTESGNDYKACFTNSGGSTYTAVATLTVGTAPVITANPASQTINAGGNTTFTAAASGSPAPTVQWEYNTGSVVQRVSANVPTNTGVLQRRHYEAVFTNSAGSTPTTAATLTVQAGLAVTQNPVSQETVFAGATATLTAAAGGSPTPTVQWEVNTGQRRLHRPNQQQRLQRRYYRHADDHRADHCDERIPATRPSSRTVRHGTTTPATLIVQTARSRPTFRPIRR